MLLAGQERVWARRAAAGRAPGYCYAYGGMKAACHFAKQRHMGERGLEELPHGERRETVLRKGDGGGMGLLWAGQRISGATRCRRASAGRLFCMV